MAGFELGSSINRGKCPDDCATATAPRISFSRLIAQSQLSEAKKMFEEKGCFFDGFSPILETIF